MNTSLFVLFLLAGTQNHLPQGLLSSLCYVESTHNIHAIHRDDGSSNSVGVCQIKLKTAKWFGFKGTEKQLMNPAINIKYSAKYLAYQIKRYHNIRRGVIAYNRGNAKGLTNTLYQAKVYKQWKYRGGLISEQNQRRKRACYLQ